MSADSPSVTAGSNRAMITLSVMLATTMQAIDTTIANVALPHMQGAMAATQDQISWVLTSYIVSAAIMTPPTGFLAARFGRKRLFIGAVAGFVVASMLAGAAANLGQLVFFRLMQGAFGASLVPLSQAVLLDIYPRHQHGRAIAIWGVGVMIGPVLGPTLGGWLTETLSWRWVFYINLPVGLMAITGLSLFVKRTYRQNKLPFDWPGFALLSLSIGALQMMLDRGQSQDWFSAPEIVIEAVLAVLCLYLFVVHIMTTRRPFLNPAMFKDRNLSMGLGFMFLVGIIFLSTMAILPPFLQTLKGWPVILTGLVLAPRGLGMMLGMMIMGRLAERFDPRFLIAGGMMMIVISLYSMSQFTLEVSQKDIIWTGFAQGLGLGSVFVPMGVITFATLDEKYRTEATALFSLVRNIGSSIGVSISFALLARNIQINHAELAAHITPFNPLVTALGITGPEGLGRLAIVNAQINQQAALIGYLNDFRFMMGISLLAAPFILLLRSPHKKGG
ncbi:MAG: DHA2 family efflux MFS transporter permease subunit [Robiginitomaculum sp.]|nr:DHA2 family efflux MFS transporter permease subunit [Robiginitomaculum sp.]MDQ7076558.1 DHA2 family efflux MFS transporter permease subunit [Robiginitomaculum sp.]